MKNLAVPKGLVILAFMLVATLPGFADDRQGRIQIGTGLLYERGLDWTVGYEFETNYHHAWEFFGNVYLKCGTTTTLGAWVRPTSLACSEAVTIMAICGWAGRSARTETRYWAAFMWAMNTAMRCARAGNCFGKPSAT